MVHNLTIDIDEDRNIGHQCEILRVIKHGCSDTEVLSSIFCSDSSKTLKYMTMGTPVYARKYVILTDVIAEERVRKE